MGTENIYDIYVYTLQGVKKSVAKFFINNDKIAGVVFIMGFEKEFSGKINGNNFYIKDNIPLMFINIAFDIHGRIEDNRLFAAADTSFGKIRITGERK